MNDSPFSSSEHFRLRFEQGILRLAEQSGAGASILSLCNGAVDAELRQKIAPRLRATFARLADDYRRLLLEGRTPEAAPDDLLVVLKVLCVGLRELEGSERRSVDGWELQFTPLRAFRPKRLAGETPRSLFKPFEPDGFHFNKPFLEQERLWEGRLEGREAALFYNKYPFARHHLLLVPERTAERPQLLDQDHHRYVWRLAASVAPRIPGAVFAYNAYGAYASVNHLHFHLLVHPEGLAVTRGEWRHNGGRRDYPAPCRAFASAEEAWAWIGRCHEENRPYNLLYTPGRLYGFPRPPQGAVEPPAWSGGFAWYEMSGAFVVADRQSFTTLDGPAVGAALSRSGHRGE